MSAVDLQRSPEINVYEFMSVTLDGLPMVDRQELMADTEIPVIGDRVCVGSNLLSARQDIEKVTAQYALTYNGAELSVMVGGFRSRKDPLQHLRLGRTKGEGIDMQRVISSNLHDAYLLTMQADKKYLSVVDGNHITELATCREFEVSPADWFARGCMFAFVDILRRRRSKNA